MKMFKIIISIFIISLSSISFAEDRMISRLNVGVVGSGTAVAAALTYIGDSATCTGESYGGVGSGKWVSNNPSNDYYTSPTGQTITIKEIIFKGKNDGTAGNVGLAVYPVDMSAPICQGHAAKSVTNGTEAWIGHVNGETLDGTCQLTTATQFVVVASTDSAHVLIGEFGSASLLQSYGNGYYAGNYPSPLSGGNGYAQGLCLRIGY